MRKSFIAACVAALAFPAHAAWEARMWEGNLSYYDTVHDMTWSDGVRDTGAGQDLFPSWNSRYYTSNFTIAPTLEQMIGLNRARQESDPFVHLTEYGPFHTQVLTMWTSTMVPCKAPPWPNQAACQQLPVGVPFDYMTPVIFSFTATGDGSYYAYQDSYANYLALKGAPGDVGVAIPVPEPETWALLVLGLAAVGARLRREGVNG